MRPFGRRWKVAAAAAAAIAMLSSPALAVEGTPGGNGGAGNGSNGGSGNGGSTGSDTGSEYADLNVVMRALDGTPILAKYVVPATTETPEVTEYCPQPVSYSPIPGVASSTTNPVDGQKVWLVPLMGQLIGSPAFTESTSACDPQSQYAMFVTPTDLARLNLARTTDTVLAQKLSDVQAKLQVGTNIALESTGRISIDGTPIDAAPENAAVYQALMTTGAIPGLSTSPAVIPSQKPAGGNSNSQFDAWKLAAMALGATADKKTPLSIDAVEYYNRIIGLPALYAAAAAANPSWKVNFVTSTDPVTKAPVPNGEQFVDYSGFTYNRSQTFTGSVTWLDTSTLTWKVEPILNVVPFHNLSPDSSTGTLTGVLAFAQMADDVRALCDYIPDNTFIPGFYMDVPGVNTAEAQQYAITHPAVALPTLPATAFETYPFQMTASLFNPFGGTLIPDARLQVTVHAPAALKEGDVTATEVPATTGADAQNVPFTVDNGDLIGSWGPQSGFPVQPGYSVSSTFNVTVAQGAPSGYYTVTLDLLSAADTSKVLASATGTITVNPNQTTVLWGSPLPQLATQDTYMAIPVQVYSPAAEGTAQLSLTVTGPAGETGPVALTPGNLTIYADNGTNMAPMTLTANGSGQLLGTWDVALGEDNTPGYTTVIWYADVPAGSPEGNYTFAVGLVNGNTLDPITVSVAASETHGQKPPDVGEDTTPPVVTITTGTVGSTASFTLSADQNGVTYSCVLTVNGVAQPPTSCEKNVKYEDLLPGSYILTVTGTNTAGIASDPVSVNWVVSSPSTPPPPSSSVNITSASSTVFTQGHAGTFKVTATGNAVPKLTAVGNLPAGVSFIDNGDGTATLAGVPSAGTDGVYVFTVVASTGTATTEQTFELTIASTPPAAPRFTSAATATFRVQQVSRFTVTATGSPTPHLSVSGTLPRGVTFADNGNGQGTLAGTPTTVGAYPLTFTAANGVLPNATQNFLLTVTAATAPAGPGVEPEGYWLVGSDGGIFTFGPHIGFYGSTGAMTLNKPIVGMAATPGGHGYWLVASDGGVFAFGDARFYGSTGNMALNKPIVGMAATHDGHGYWLVASDGGIFAFGDAAFYGSTGNLALSKPVVGMAATPSGHGYWLVGSDGGIFTFGDARFFGSTGAMTLNKPIVGMASPDARGYWLVASDGGIFAFGDAPFYGSTGAMALNKPIVGMAENPATGGYWLVASDGGVFSFHTPFYGSTGAMTLNKPIVGMASAA